MHPNQDELYRDHVERVAFRLWEERGRPVGSPEVDWHRAEQEVMANNEVELPISSAAASVGGQ